eukprot:TRINITY_DN14849_c0_g1_i1.p1 TRINITY_DN14849_c0_g1~~TRINITY_DN14849_c0_g1_i1.p1  ORF type:complete len:542 (+),score=146.26 TRINITY_DN14849_c0_g1_i1:70-1695(+)
MSELPCGLSARRLKLNGILMSACFAWTKGAIVTILGVSASLIDQNLNAVAGLILYAGFVVGSVVSPGITVRLGLKRSLLVGLLGFSVFAAGFVYPEYFVLCPAAAFSGVMGGVLWAAQGQYLAANSVAYTRALSDDESRSLILEDFAAQNKRSMGMFTGIFGALFALALLVCRVTASLIVSTGHVQMLYVSYTALAVLATLGMSFVWDFPVSEAERQKVASPRSSDGVPVRASLWAEAVASVSATLSMLRDPRMLLMVPYNVTFGLASGYFPCVMTPYAADLHGAHVVGLLYATAGATSFILATPYALLSNRFACGRSAVMLWGGACYAAVFLVMTFAPPTDLASLYFLFAVYGSAQIVWQSSTPAVFAAYWPDDTSTAFANLKLHSGLATLLAYAAFPYAGTARELAPVVALPAVVSMATYSLAARWGSASATHEQAPAAPAAEKPAHKADGDRGTQSQDNLEEEYLEDITSCDPTEAAAPAVTRHASGLPGSSEIAFAIIEAAQALAAMDSNARFSESPTERLLGDADEDLLPSGATDV